MKKEECKKYRDIKLRRIIIIIYISQQEKESRRILNYIGAYTYTHVLYTQL